MAITEQHSSQHPSRHSSQHSSQTQAQNSSLTNTILNGDCIELMRQMPAASVDFILTDPPYLVNYRDRAGRSIRNDSNEDWLRPAMQQAWRVLKQDRVAVMFYGWNKIDAFFAAWREAGFRPVGHLVFRKSYASKSRLVRYQHEQAYLLAKGKPPLPNKPIADVIDVAYSGNRASSDAEADVRAGSADPELLATRRSDARSVRGQRLYLRGCDAHRAQISRDGTRCGVFLPGRAAHGSGAGTDRSTSDPWASGIPACGDGIRVPAAPQGEHASEMGVLTALTRTALRGLVSSPSLECHALELDNDGSAVSFEPQDCVSGLMTETHQQPKNVISEPWIAGLLWCK